MSGCPESLGLGDLTPPGRRRLCQTRARRPRPGGAMRFESHFKSYFGNVKAFNLKKFKIIAEPVAAMAGGGP